MKKVTLLSILLIFWKLRQNKHMLITANKEGRIQNVLIKIFNWRYHYKIINYLGPHSESSISAIIRIYLSIHLLPYPIQAISNLTNLPIL